MTMTMYKCIKDLQNADWCVGTVALAEEWLSFAEGWATSDNNPYLMEGVAEVKKRYAQGDLTERDVIDHIAETWRLEIVKGR